MPDAPHRRRFAAIVNPVSGRRSMLPVVEHIGKLVEQRGGQLVIRVSKCAGHAATLAAELDDSTEAVLIVGGDGTVGEVLQGLDAQRIPFLILRTGTENLLARELNMPDDPDEVARVLVEGHSRAFDLGHANERRFASVVGIGFDAECVLRLPQKRAGHITHLDYFWPIWKTFWCHRFPHLLVEADGDRVFDDRGLVVIGNIGRYARNLRILHDARWEDGLFDVAIFPCSSRWQLVVHAFRVLMRRHVEHAGTRYFQCERLTVRSADNDVPVQIDGDAGGLLPIDVTISRHAASFLSPQSIEKPMKYALRGELHHAPDRKHLADDGACRRT